jgi:peroxiredoxin family protein
MKSSLAVFLHDHRYDRLHQASSILLTASSLGWPSHVFLFYGALASYMKGTWDEINLVEAASDDPRDAWMPDLERGFEQANLPSLYDMIDKAAGEEGGLKVYACSASCKILGLDIKSVRDKVDEIVGLPTMLKIAAEVKHVMYI